MTQILLPVPHVPQHQQGECLVACATMIPLYLGQTVNYDKLQSLALGPLDGNLFSRHELH